MFNPSPLGLGGSFSSRAASSSLVSIELCLFERREWLLGCSLDARDVASSSFGESDLFASSDRLDVLESDLCASSDLLDVLE